MKFADVGGNVKRLLNELPPRDEFIYELLLAYKSEPDIERNGPMNLRIKEEPGPRTGTFVSQTTRRRMSR